MLGENLSNKIEVESARTQIRGNLNRLSAVQNNMELWTNLLNEKELNFAAIDDQERQMTTGTTPAQI